jgi:hypothetical protein
LDRRLAGSDGSGFEFAYTPADAHTTCCEEKLGLWSDFLSRKKIQDQAKHEAMQFAKRLPKERVGNQKLLTSEFEIAQAHLLGYKRQGKLGVYGTSSLINGFRWGLIDAGYDKALVEELSRELTLKLAGEK